MVKIKLNRYVKISLSLLAIVVIIGVIYGFTWTYNNTSILRGDISEQDLAKNNSSSLESPFELKPQQVGGRTLYAPDGFLISIYATGINDARFFTFSPSGTMFVGSKNGDGIYAIPSNDGAADTPILIENRLDTPHSLYYYKNDLYLAEQSRVSVYRNIKDDGSFDSKEILVSNLPGGNTLTGGGHTTRTVVIGPDEKMYVSVGSSCNVCIEDDSRRATIMRYDLNGSNEEIYASGLRNTVGFGFFNNTLWGLDMGRDQIGDDIPPEEVNIIEKGKDYGWPYCYGDKINNPEFEDRQEYCQTKTTGPVLELQAHDAPLGMTFMNSDIENKWPGFLKNGFIAAMHGSWNRTIPTGYKLIWVDITSEKLQSHNLITGWLDREGAWGRPVGVGFDPSGSLYISDDKQDLIYKVVYSPTSN